MRCQTNFCAQDTFFFFFFTAFQSDEYFVVMFVVVWRRLAQEQCCVAVAERRLCDDGASMANWQGACEKHFFPGKPWENQIAKVTPRPPAHPTPPPTISFCTFNGSSTIVCVLEVLRLLHVGHGVGRPRPGLRLELHGPRLRVRGGCQKLLRQLHRGGI